MTDYDRNVTAPCGCSWTLPSGQIQSRCAEHREPSQPSQPAFDAEAAREAVHRMAEAANSGEPIAPTLEAIHAALKLVADIADMLPAALDHIARLTDENHRREKAAEQPKAEAAGGKT